MASLVLPQKYYHQMVKLVVIYILVTTFTHMLLSPFLLKSVWKLQHGHSGTGYQLSVPDFYGFFMFLCLVNSGHQFEYYPLSIWPDRRPKCSHPPCSGLDVSSFHSLPFSATSHTKCKFLLVHQSEPSDRSPVIGPK